MTEPSTSLKTVLLCAFFIMGLCTIWTFHQSYYLISQLERSGENCTDKIVKIGDKNSQRLLDLNTQIKDLIRIEGVLRAETNVMLGRLEQMALIFGGLEGKPKFQQLIEWFQAMYDGIQKSHKTILEDVE